MLYANLDMPSLACIQAPSSLNFMALSHAVFRVKYHAHISNLDLHNEFLVDNIECIIWAWVVEVRMIEVNQVSKVQKAKKGKCA